MSWRRSFVFAVAPLVVAGVDGEQISLPAGRPGMVMFSTSYCSTCFVSAKSSTRCLVVVTPVA